MKRIDTKSTASRFGVKKRQFSPITEAVFREYVLPCFAIDDLLDVCLISSDWCSWSRKKLVEFAETTDLQVNCTRMEIPFERKYKNKKCDVYMSQVKFVNTQNKRVYFPFDQERESNAESEIESESESESESDSDEESEINTEINTEINDSPTNYHYNNHRESEEELDDDYYNYDNGCPPQPDKDRADSEDEGGDLTMGSDYISNMIQQQDGVRVSCNIQFPYKINNQLSRPSRFSSIHWNQFVNCNPARNNYVAQCGLVLSMITWSTNYYDDGEFCYEREDDEGCFVSESDDTDDSDTDDSDEDDSETDEDEYYEPDLRYVRVCFGGLC